MARNLKIGDQVVVCTDLDSFPTILGVVEKIGPDYSTVDGQLYNNWSIWPAVHLETLQILIGKRMQLKKAYDESAGWFYKLHNDIVNGDVDQARWSKLPY